MITFVTSYFDLSEDTIKRIARLIPTVQEKELVKAFSEQKELINLCFQSAELFHPGCQKVLLTDLNTQFSLSGLPRIFHGISKGDGQDVAPNSFTDNREDCQIDKVRESEGEFGVTDCSASPREHEIFGLPSNVQIHRYDVDLNKPNYSRMVCYYEYLKQVDGSSHLLFLDNDILLQTNLESVFEQDFDVALTSREARYPVNIGVLFVHRKRLNQACLFFEKIFDIFETFPPYRDLWWGDQRAILNLVGDKSVYGLLEIEGIKILFLPGSIYNFSTTRSSDMANDLPNRSILHFKGNRKQYMRLYWENYLKAK